jgi:hypothetical protein
MEMVQSYYGGNQEAIFGAQGKTLCPGFAAGFESGF